MVTKQKKIGNEAENIALRYLEDKQLELVERNFSVPHGEIDLIMKDREQIVFVEVRKRSNTDYANALDTIDIHKQKRITMAAYIWMKINTYKDDCRFDVVALDKDNSVEWVKNAFEAVEL